MTQKKRSITLHGHRTSVSLEPEFWAIIEQFALKQDRSIASLIVEIDDRRVMEKSPRGLATYLRVWALKKVQFEVT